MANTPRFVQAYTLDALTSLPFKPVVAKRAPTTADTGFGIGTLWIEPKDTTNTAVNAAWVLTSIINNLANWLPIQAGGGGGAGLFASLTVTPGPTSITGTTGINTAGAGVTTINTGGTGALLLGNATGNTAVTGSLTASNGLVATAGGITATGTSAINTTGAAVTSIGSITGASGIIERVGTGNYSLDGVAASTYSIGASTTTGTITIGGTAQTGNVNLGTSSGIVAVGIGNGAGANSVFIASNGTGSTVIGNTTGQVSLIGQVQLGTIGPKILFGAGSPNAVVTAPQGSLYLNTAGSGVADRAFINTNGTTGWTAITTVA